MRFHFILLFLFSFRTPTSQGTKEHSSMIMERRLIKPFSTVNLSSHKTLLRFFYKYPKSQPCATSPINEQQTILPAFPISLKARAVELGGLAFQMGSARPSTPPKMQIMQEVHVQMPTGNLKNALNSVNQVRWLYPSRSHTTYRQVLSEQ